MNTPSNKKRLFDSRTSHGRHPVCGTCGEPLAGCGLSIGRVIFQFDRPGRPRFGFHLPCTDTDLVARRILDRKVSGEEPWRAVDDIAVRGPDRVIASAPYWCSRPQRLAEVPQPPLFPGQFADHAVQ